MSIRRGNTKRLTLIHHNAMQIIITHVIDVPDDVFDKKKATLFEPKFDLTIPKLESFTHNLQATFRDGRTKLVCSKCSNRQSSCALSCIKCGTPIGSLVAKLVELKVK